MIPGKVCKDCERDYQELTSAQTGIVGMGEPLRGKPRPIVPGSGGRCATHWRYEKKRRKTAAHERRVQQVYGLPPGTYEALYEAQGGRCYICQWATGKTRRLSVDHDHKTGYVRGLACRPCNSMLGHARDDIDFFLRAVEYLREPPARRLGIVAIHEEERDD